MKVGSLALMEERSAAFSEEDLVNFDPVFAPRHIALIMDGNRRWAQQEDLLAADGHWRGGKSLMNVVCAAVELGVNFVTAFTFSTENWARPQEEVDALMRLFEMYLKQERGAMIKNGVKLGSIGDLTLFPGFVVEELQKTKAATAHCSRIELILALNYGGRDDIRRAVSSIVDDCEKKKLHKDDITEETISSYLDTSARIDPDLLIRTGGEMRLSNFLLWQLSYSEVYVTDVLWPNFSAQDLLRAVLKYQKRERRYGE